MAKISALFILTMLTVVLTISAADASQINWDNNLATAYSRAHANHKILMVDFYTDWCGWCKKLDSDVYPDPSVIRAVGQFEAVKVNAEKEGADLAHQCNVTGYPTIAFFNGDGTEIKNIPGFLPADQFASNLNTIAQTIPYVSATKQSGISVASTLSQRPDTKLVRLDSLLNADPNRTDIEFKIVSFELSSGQIGDAERFAAKLAKQGHTAKLDHIYNSIGDTLAGENRVPEAAGAYNAALSYSGLDTHSILYSRIRLSQCFEGLGDAKDAKAQLHDIVDAPYTPQDVKQQAQSQLAQ